MTIRIPIIDFDEVFVTAHLQTYLPSILRHSLKILVNFTLPHQLEKIKKMVPLYSFIFGVERVYDTLLKMNRKISDIINFWYSKIEISLKFTKFFSEF